MKLKLGLLSAAAVLAATPIAAEAETPRDKATGGGQILIDPSNPPTTGALDTVAFTAQRERGATDDSGLADGQVQVNRRSGTEEEQVKFHGVVECLIVVGNKAYISGVQRGTDVPFELYVVDGGSGAQERSGDQGLVWYGAETEENEPDNLAPGNFTPPQEDEFCGIEEDPSSKRQIPALARGNYQVRDANPSQTTQASKSRSSTTRSTSLTSALR